MTKPTPFSVRDVLDWTLDLRFFHPMEVLDGGTAIPVVRKNGAEDSRFVLVLGSNAGGKSFFRRIVSTAFRMNRKPQGFGRPARKDCPFPVREVIHLSMEGRGDSFGGLRSMVYGDESRMSTGECSAHTVVMAIKTVTGRDHDVVLYWDEPDTGMSDSSAAGAGLDIKDFLADLPENVKAVFLTTHSKVMAAQFVDLDPHYLYFGDANGPATLSDWLTEPVIPVRPAELQDVSRARYLAIQKILNDKK